MAVLESDVTVVNYGATPIYRGSELMPIGITFESSGLWRARLLAQHLEQGAVARWPPLGELEALIPPTRPLLSEHDWTAIEQRLRLRLPADYKALVEAYGPGSFDRFIWVLQPSETNQHLDLLRQRKTRLDALRTLEADGEVSPFGIEADHQALVPWAITENGDVCYWVTDESKEPEEWTISVNEARGPRWETFEGSASEFLFGVISRSLGVGLFPEDFPSDKPTFEAFAV